MGSHKAVPLVVWSADTVVVDGPWAANVAAEGVAADIVEDNKEKD